MGINAPVQLELLQCIKETEHHGSNPYLWVLLLQTDLEEAETTGVTRVGWSSTYEQVLAHGLRTGQSVKLPADLLEGPGASWPDGVQFPSLIIAALLWDKHHTPGSAVEAGFGAFVDALTLSLADSIHDLVGATAAEAKKIISEIESVVTNAVHRAIKHHLSLFEEIFDTLDSAIGTAFQPFEPVTMSSIQLVFDSNSDHHYEVLGQLQVTEVPPVAGDRA